MITTIPYISLQLGLFPDYPENIVQQPHDRKLGFLTPSSTPSASYICVFLGSFTKQIRFYSILTLLISYFLLYIKSRITLEE